MTQTKYLIQINCQKSYSGFNVEVGYFAGHVHSTCGFKYCWDTVSSRQRKINTCGIFVCLYILKSEAVFFTSAAIPLDRTSIVLRDEHGGPLSQALHPTGPML